MKKTLSIVLAAIMLLCVIPTFTVFAEEDKFATIDSAQELADFTKAINENKYIPAAGSTVKVTADLDMRKIGDFQPINLMQGFTLDFDGHTVSNLAVITSGATTSGANSGSNRFAGIIAHSVQNGASVINLKIDNCKLTADARRTGLVAGYINNAVVNNIAVENSTVQTTHTGENNQRYIASVIGSLDYSQYTLNATAKNIVLESDVADCFGAVVGSFWKSKITFGDSKAENITAKKNGTVVKAEFFGEKSTGADGLCLIVPDGATVVVTNVDNATGYIKPADAVDPIDPIKKPEVLDFPIKENSPLKGISVGFYGDSICAAGADNGTAYEYVRGWAGRIGVPNQMVWTNHGVSGASVSNVRGTNTIIAQLRGVHKTGHELLILHGGTNDAWSGAPVGTMTEGFGPSDSYDVSTFAGGLEQVFAYIREVSPDATVGYIINFKFVNANRGEIGRYTDDDGTIKSGYLLDHMNDYVDMTKKICDKWGVPYLDLYSDDELTDKLHPYVLSASGKKTYQATYVYDFVHPSPDGYNIIYPYIEDFMIKLVSPDDPNQGGDEVVVTDPVDPPVSAPVTDPAPEKKGGCKSFAGGSVALVSIISLAGVSVLAKKRKNI